MAPFWRGLNDFKEDWTEHQLVAAARGLPIPAADEVPPEDPERPVPAESPRSSNPNLQNLTVPISSRSHSCASDASATISPSHPAFSLPPPTSPITTSSPHLQPSTPFRPRSKTVASLTTSSKSPSQTDMVPREIQLPQDPYVNGQAMEAFLYKDATECPICFVYYPPYLNKTRCCDQPICSECFVQIKRPDPHPPEHEHNDPSNPTPQSAETHGDPEGLVSEPANCPYCQQAEFGVTYEPPPFRRGLAYAGTGQRTPLGNVTSAMSSSSSLNSLGSPSLAPASAPRRRTTSISANASTVITTDRIRPDWATKLANARNHAARRSAAATALHTAAYLMGNGMADSRGFAFTRGGRFGRRGMDSPGSGAATPPTPQSGGGPGGSLSPFSLLVDRHEARNREAGALGQSSTASRRRSRMDDLEDMMMLEAIRLSLAAEEERKRKEEKEARKEAKKKEKADKKADKAAKKSMYSAGGTSSASASGSALSLSLPGIGRRRGNSGSSTLLREAAMNADKGKNVDRSYNSGSAAESSTAPLTIGKPVISVGLSSRSQLDTGIGGLHFTEAPQPSPTTTAPEKPSHLRQMSNASSPASSFMESLPGSLRNGGFHGSSSSLDSPSASGTHLGGSGTPDREADSDSAGTEPMFNFRSLAEMMGREDEKEDAAKHIEHLKSGNNDIEEGESSVIPENPFDDKFGDELEQSVTTLKADDGYHDANEEIMHTNGDEPLLGVGSKLPTPELMVTPVTPAATESQEEEGKQLGAGMGFLMGDGRNTTQ
jgi:hypothetical protein